jgi:carbon storage regulator
MLVLSRQRDETIMIGDEVEITVVDIRGDKVRLGITAPRRIQVHRKEVYEAIKRENRQASQLSPHDVSGVVERGGERPAPPDAAPDTPDRKEPQSPLIAGEDRSGKEPDVNKTNNDPRQPTEGDEAR